MGWILTIFDLPVVTNQQRKLATRFRNDLMDEGFVMIQFSVYARSCVTHEMLEKYTKKIMKLAPDTGLVHLIFITDHQWGKIMTIKDPDYQGNREEPEMPDQMTFWE